MFKFSSMLPFSSISFYYFFVVTVVLFFVLKKTLSKKISYRNLLLFFNSAFILFLFPKPLQLLGLVLFSFFTIRFFSKRDVKLIIPVLTLSLPLILMKFINIEFFGGINEKLEVIFQVAGISYITFRSIQVYIDEKEQISTLKLVDFYNFTVFIPSLLIGPIDRFKRFTTDVQIGYQNLNRSNYIQAYQFLLKGVVYKYILAEFISRLILNHLVNDNSMVYHLSYMYSYLIYLFFDFAGYSLLAMSFAKFIGISLPYNFDKPFLAKNPKEFWQKWHKSLGDWLNDYFFKPIFKELTSRKISTSIRRQNISLLLTFTLMGFWNGFERHFILSGVLFGVYSMVYNYYVYLCKKNKKDVFFGTLSPKLISSISIFLMFNAVAFSIYIFSGKLF